MPVSETSRDSSRNAPGFGRFRPVPLRYWELIVEAATLLD
jgi:hypothetical protein